MVEDMKELIVEDDFFITGRGQCFSVDFEKNEIAGTKEELFNLLLNQTIVVERKQWIVKGIELFAIQGVHNRGGILVKPVEND